MKKILYLLLVTSVIQANDLIYKHGFENNVLLFGTVTGINSLGLSLRLQAGLDNIIDETVAINQNGGFAFSNLLKIGDNYTISISSLPNNPNQQSCELIYPGGVVPNNGVIDITVMCDNSAWNWNKMNWNEGGWQ